MLAYPKAALLWDFLAIAGLLIGGGILDLGLLLLLKDWAPSIVSISLMGIGVFLAFALFLGAIAVSDNIQKQVLDKAMPHPMMRVGARVEQLKKEGKWEKEVNA